MNAASDTALAGGWISERPVPLDHNGSTDRPFEAIAPEWLDQPVWNYVEQVAARDPDHVIIDDGTTKVTYRDLVRQVRPLAWRLLAEVPTGKPVALLLRNEAWFPIVQMAAVAAGLPSVPLDAASAVERKELLLRESGAGAIVTLDDPAIDLSFVPPGLPVFRIDLQSTDDDDTPLTLVPRDLDAPIMIGFTSGSTGRAKGIAYSERQMMRLVAEHIAVHHINRDDVILGIASLTAAGIREAIVTLLTGALLRPLDFKAAGLMEGLRVMREERVSFLSFVPSYLRMLMQVPGIEQSFAHLRVLELGGEVTTKEDVALFRRTLPAGCRISLAFGSTETGLMFRWFVDDAKMVDGAPLGYLADGRTIAILGEDDLPVVPGEAGEMVVSDAMVALGYWRDGGIDTSRFRPHAGDPGIRTVRSGDRIRMRPDGLVEFAGRVDRMVKINGLQVDQGEVESVLKDVASVADAAVVTRHREGEGAKLIAFVVPRDPAVPLDQAMLRQAVADEAAEHMIPHTIRTIDELPRLHNGKPDLVRLAAMAEADA